MKVLIVYYSLNGNTTNIANELHRYLNSNILKLEPILESSSKGLLKYFWQDQQVLTKEKPLLKNYEIDFTSYDLIIIGTPVWSGSFVPAIKSFLINEKESLCKKNLAIFCTYDSRSSRTFKEFKEFFKEYNNIVSEKGFSNSCKKNDLCQNRVSDWAEELINWFEKNF